VTVEKYMGPGGDTGYEDFGSAMNTLVGVGNFSDNYKITATADFLNSTVCLDGINKIRPNGYGLEIDLAGHEITTSEMMLVNAWSLDYSADNTVKGVFAIHSGNIKPHTSWGTPSHGSLLKIVGGYFTSENDQRFDAYNLKIANSVAIPKTCIELSQASGQGLWVRCYNNRIFCTGAGHGLFVGGNGSIYWSGSTKSKFIENCSIYHDGEGVTPGSGVYFLFGDSNTGWASFRNVFASKWYSAGYTTFDIKNCADSDGSLTVGTGNVTAISSSDFVSVDPDSADFLKLSADSMLRNVGTTDIAAWNTLDFLGRPRPNYRGYASIGAHEPVGANVTLRVYGNNNWYSTTKQVIL
jgi:hypothetical protein